MADYYLQTSQVIAHLGPEESEWLHRQLELVDEFDREQSEEGTSLVGQDDDLSDWSGYRFLRDYPLADDNPQILGFCYEFDESPNSDWGSHLWLYCEECGDLGQMAHLVQKFLRTFRPDTYWCLVYATTCSKPRIGSSSGGAVFVTAERVLYQSADEWLERQAARFDRRHRPQHGHEIRADEK